MKDMERKLFGRTKPWMMFVGAGLLVAALAVAGGVVYVSRQLATKSQETRSLAKSGCDETYRVQCQEKGLKCRADLNGLNYCSGCLDGYSTCSSGKCCKDSGGGGGRECKITNCTSCHTAGGSEVCDACKSGYTSMGDRCQNTSAGECQEGQKRCNEISPEICEERKWEFYGTYSTYTSNQECREKYLGQGGGGGSTTSSGGGGGGGSSCEKGPGPCSVSCESGDSFDDRTCLSTFDSCEQWAKEACGTVGSVPRTFGNYGGDSPSGGGSTSSGGGYVPEEVSIPTPTPIQYCINVYFYVNQGGAWTKTKKGDLVDRIRIGDTIRLAVKPVGKITRWDKARFFIDNDKTLKTKKVEPVETALVNEQGEFYLDYTIPSPIESTSVSKKGTSMKFEVRAELYRNLTKK